MANNIFKYKGLKIGNSIYEKNVDNIILRDFLTLKKMTAKFIFRKTLRSERDLTINLLKKSFERY